MLEGFTIHTLYRHALTESDRCRAGNPSTVIRLLSSTVSVVSALKSEGQVTQLAKELGSTEAAGIVLINTGIANPSLKERVRNHEKYPPFGLLSLEASLRMHGYRTMVCDLVSDSWTKEELVRRMLEFDTFPLAIGISVYTENAFLIPQLIELLGIHYPRTRIVVGGPHVSFLPNEGLDAGADFIVRFEGEATLIALLEHIKYPKAVPLESISGITYRGEAGEIMSTPRRAELSDLDILPFSERFFSRDDNARKIYMVTSRGCPGTCIFCSSGAYSGRRYRQHSANRLLSMIYYALHKSPHLDHIEFIDDTFTTTKRRLTELCRMIQCSGLSVTWGARSRIDGLDETFIAYLSENGCTALHLGVESAWQQVLDAIQKKISIEDFYSNYFHLVRYGIWPRCSFIIGHHADTLQSIEETLMLAVELERNGLGMVAIGVSTPFPGTPLHDRAEELGVVMDSHRWRDYNMEKPVYHTKQFQATDIRKALYLFHNDKDTLLQEGCLSGQGQPGFRQHLTKWIASLKEMEKGTARPNLTD